MNANRFVADLGNSRLKWARVDESGRLIDHVALPLEMPAWENAWSESPVLSRQASSWAISSVNPPLAAALSAFLTARSVDRQTWFLAASEVPVAKDVEGAETGGADRALAVLAATRLMEKDRPGLVILCGTAITVERVTAQGVWQGGAIAPGLDTAARALHLRAAQIPLIDTRALSLDHSPPTWGRGTVSSLAAGVFWGTVGTVRELISRQEPDLGGAPWVVWAGGDAALIANHVLGESARVIPELVLVGLVHVISA